MSDDLGLDQLTDDQLFELVRAVAVEVTQRRDGHLHAAARTAIMEAEAEAASILKKAEADTRRVDAEVDAARARAQAATRDREARIRMAEIGVNAQVDARAHAVASAAAKAATLSRADVEGFDDWSLARRAAMMIAETLHENWSFQAWRSKTGLRRVYLEGWLPGGQRGQKRIGAKIVYHVDGDTRYPPGYIEYEYGDFREVDCDQVTAIVRYIATCWQERPEVPVSRALATTVTPAPRPLIYAERIL